MSEKNYNDDRSADSAGSKPKKGFWSYKESDLPQDDLPAKQPRSKSKSDFSDELDENELYDDRQPSERDYRPIRTRRDGKTGCLGGVMYFIFIVSVSTILACLAWMAASDVLALNKEELTAEIVLPQEIFTKYDREIKDKDGKVTGTKPDWKANSMGDVAKILKDAGIIEYKFLFKLYSSFSNANIKIDPGTYELSTQFDYRAIVKKMQFGSESQVRTKVTFPEGFTNKQIFLRLEENKICQYDELMECAANEEFDYNFLKDIPMGNASRLEGFLFPDTYEFYQGMTPRAAIDTFLQIFNKRLTKEMLDLSAARGYTLQQTLNVASMIEKEAAN
ncbi:MAG: endolytic transglycosylase MltG, partial [Oscillospiraceae bacterium]